MNVNVASFGSPAAGPAHAARFETGFESVAVAPTSSMPAKHALASSLPGSLHWSSSQPTRTSTSQLWGGDTRAAASQAATLHGHWGGVGNNGSYANRNAGIAGAQTLDLTPLELQLQRNSTIGGEIAGRTPGSCSTAREQQADYFMELLQDASPLTARPSATNRPAPAPIEDGGAQTFER